MGKKDTIYQTIWEGKVRFVLRGNKEERAFSLDVDFKLGELFDILDKTKPRWRKTVVSSLIGLFENLKTRLILYEIMGEMDDIHEK